MTQLYSVRSAGEAQFTIMKFDRDFNLESVYALDAQSCACPQGARRKPCRHRKLLPEFIAKGHINDGWFLDWDTRLWREPLAGESEAEEAASAEMHSRLEKQHPELYEAPNSQETGEAGAFCVSAEGDRPALAVESPLAAPQVAASAARGTFKRRRVA